jgi:hypothetical protein
MCIPEGIRLIRDAGRVCGSFDNASNGHRGGAACGQNHERTDTSPASPAVTNEGRHRNGEEVELKEWFISSSPCSLLPLSLHVGCSRHV